MLFSVLIACRPSMASCRRVLSLCCILTAQTLNAQTPGISGTNVVIGRITSEQGLSDNTVWAITQDKQGFVWFGTSNGLNRYDGKHCVVYHRSSDSSGLSDDQIWSLYADTDGSIWIGTHSGLNRFDPSTRTFKKYFHDPDDPTSLSGNNVGPVYRDGIGVLWVGTDWGLNRFEKNTGTWTRFLPTPDDSTRQGDNHIDAILEDRHGRLWIGTGNFLQGGGDLYQFDRDKEAFSRFDYSDSSEFKAWNLDWVTSLFEDDSGSLWICSNYRGVYKLDEVSLTHTYVGFFRSSAKGIRVDRKGNPWIATWGPGLFRFEQQTGTYTRYSSDAVGSSRISSSRINTIFLDRAGLLWVGTEEGGVNTVSTKPFLIRQKLGDSLQIGNRIDGILVDKDGRLWIAATEFGIFRFDPRTHQSTLMSDLPVNTMFQDKAGAIWSFTHPFVIRFDSSRSTFTTVWTIPGYGGEDADALCVDSEGCLWVGTNWGLYRIERSMKKYTYFVHDPKDPLSITGGEVTVIFNDKSGNIWVGTTEGVNRFEKESQSFTHFNYDKRDSSSVSDNYCSGIWEDGSGTLWISTGHDIYRFNEASLILIRVLDRAFGQIAQDRKGRFWFSARGGKLSMFNPADGSLKEFGASDGLEDVEVRREGHCATLKSGEILFCTTNGILVFNPDSVITLTYVPPVVITGINRFTKPVNLGTSPELLREVTFAHDENVFSIDYAALSYDMSEYNQYAYMLVGFDKDWVYCGNTQEATYTNLDPGAYTFRVKGSNYDGVWNEEGVSIAVIITPPFWKTWWAYTLYVVLTAGLLYTLRRYEMNRQRLGFNYELEKVESAKLKEMDGVKSRFFANISHEFRTPLTLILGPVEAMVASARDESSRENLGLVHRNARRLLALVNQLLDLSRIEAQQMKLRTQETEIVEFVRGVAASFESLAVRRSIQLSVAWTEPIVGYIDSDVMEKILTNLLSNAFKFTNDGGQVTLELWKDVSSQAFCITVSDTGIGISPDQLDRIFDRFYQVDDTHTREREGTGIGLALTKELVHLHKGEITVSSEPGHGSTFTVKIPFARNRFGPEEISAEPRMKEDSVPQTAISASSGEEVQDVPGEAAPALLVIEDNADMRRYIRERLQHSYAITEAENGVAGVEMAIASVPDLIISDVMMPMMDGFEVCKRLKEDVRTSHIPIILLTAKAGTGHRIEGLQIGADDYLVKPFDAKELQVRAANLIEQRRLLRARFRTEVVLKPQDITVTPVDHQFLNRVMALVEEHMGESDFDTEFMAKELFLSRMQLHRKLKALTDRSPHDFVRAMRLQRAAQLLRKRAGNVSEVAFEVGFNNLSHFAKSFREEFGQSPSEFLAGIPRSDH